MYGGVHKWRYPNSWMVYNGKSQSKMEDLGYPPILGTLHINTWYIFYVISGLVKNPWKNLWRYEHLFAVHVLCVISNFKMIDTQHRKSIDVHFSNLQRKQKKTTILLTMHDFCSHSHVFVKNIENLDQEYRHGSTDEFKRTSAEK